VKTAEKNFSMSHLTLALSLGFVALLVRDYLRWRMSQQEGRELAEQIDRLIRSRQIQHLVDPLQQKIIDQITNGWRNDSYADGIKKATWHELISGLRK
jgi:hypothetical protein